MKKALLVTTVSGFVPQFEMNNVKILQEMGYEVHYAANFNIPSYGNDNHRLEGSGIICHQIDFVRSPYSLKNLNTYRQLKQLMEDERFSLVHCHTPMGGVMARLVSHKTKTGPVIYTAHGFHFFDGAPLINWLCYYPVEKWLSRYTFQQICINEEDYRHAQKFLARHVDYIPGAGLNLRTIPQISGEQLVQKRHELGISLEKKIILSVGELIKRKNHESVIRAIAKLKDPSVVYLICGHGELEEYLKNLAIELNVDKQVIFAGYCNDIFTEYQIADLFVFPSYQEGLPMALLEAMSCGLPVICSDIRGNRDLMGDSVKNQSTKEYSMHLGGVMVNVTDDVDGYVSSIKWCLENSEWMKECGSRNRTAVSKFSLEKVEKIMRSIYQRAIEA